MRLLDDRLDFRRRHLCGLYRLAGHGECARRHDLDQVRALLDLLAHCLAHLVGAVGLAIHRREEPAAGRGRRDDLAAQHEARPGAQLRPDRPAQGEQLATVAAEVARRRDAALEHRARGGRLSVGPHIRLVGELAARRGRQREAVEVHVGVDQPRHHRAPAGVDDAVAVGGDFPVGDLGDDPVADQHGRALARRPAGSVDHAPAHERKPALADRRRAVEIGCPHHARTTLRWRFWGVLILASAA